jgi:hypothetical protein
MYVGMQYTIAVGISFPKKIMAKIDSERGDVPRSRFLLRLLEDRYTNTHIQIENNKAQSKIRKPLQADFRVGGSVNQSATDSMKIASEGDSIHG